MAGCAVEGHGMSGQDKRCCSSSKLLDLGRSQTGFRAQVQPLTRDECPVHKSLQFRDGVRMCDSGKCPPQSLVTKKECPLVRVESNRIWGYLGGLGNWGTRNSLWMRRDDRHAVQNEGVRRRGGEAN